MVVLEDLEIQTAKIRHVGDQLEIVSFCNGLQLEPRRVQFHQQVLNGRQLIFVFVEDIAKEGPLSSLDVHLQNVYHALQHKNVNKE